MSTFSCSRIVIVRVPSTWINISSSIVACSASVVGALVGVFTQRARHALSLPSRVSRVESKTPTSAPITFCTGSAEVTHSNHITPFTASNGKKPLDFASYNPNADLYHGGLSNGMIFISRNFRWTSGFSCWLFEYQVASPPLLKSEIASIVHFVRLY